MTEMMQCNRECLRRCYISRSGSG